MFKNLTKLFIVCFLVAAVSGCTVRHYSQRKERVDQEMTGNAGYLGGTPPPGATDRSDTKTTRKVYVWEVQSKDKKQDEAAPAVSSSKERVSVSKEPQEAQKPTIAVPREILEDSSAVESAAPAESKSTGVAGVSLPAEYTIEKGDTLQKISKKFYDTYRKWNKIYDANKEKIKDPNRVKTGITITIPAL